MLVFWFFEARTHQRNEEKKIMKSFTGALTALLMMSMLVALSG